MRLRDVIPVLGNVASWDDIMWPAFKEIVLVAIVRGWARLLNEANWTETWKENQFSTALFIMLERLRDASDELRVIAFQLEPRIAESEAALLSGQIDPDTLARIEIVVRHAGMSRQISLPCEAKVLTTRTVGGRRPRRSVEEYVDEGMRRFVEQRYGRGVPVGVMLGIVISGQCAELAKRIARMVVERNLPCIINVTAVEQGPVSPEHYRSAHPRQNSQDVVLEHLLLQAQRITS